MTLETSQATLVKVLLYLKHAVRNVIPLVLANLTKSVLTFTGEQQLILLLYVINSLISNFYHHHQPFWP